MKRYISSESNSRTEKTIHLTRKENNNNYFLESIRRFSWAILGVCALLQCLLFVNFENIIVVLLVLIAWGLVTKFFLNNKQLWAFPLSTFLIVGFCVTHFYFPLVFTLLEGKPVVYNLTQPLSVFLHSLITLFVLIITHSIYRSFDARSRLGTALNKVKLYEPPTDIQVWAMGFIGLGAMFYIYFYSPSVGREATGAADKAIQAFVPFTYAPFFIPFGKLYGKREPVSKRLIFMLIAFTLLLFVVSLGRNSRGAFMLGFTSVVFAYGLGLLLGLFKSQLLTFKNVFIAGSIVWLLTGPIADLGTAMVLVRAQRNSTARSELIKQTLEVYQNKEALEAAKNVGKKEKKDWDEDYMDNIFLARFCNMKYNDASLVMADKLKEHDADILDFSIDRLITTLPAPFIEALNINVDKKSLSSVSFGDYLYVRAGAGESALGAFRTGHYAGTGMAAFGWWYVLILALLMLPVYLLIDKLSFRITNNQYPSWNPKSKEPGFSLCALLSLTLVFTFLQAESVVSIATFIIRGWAQVVLLYLAIFHITRFMISAFRGSRFKKTSNRVRVNVNTERAILDSQISLK
ncbi:hypothetical protein ACFQ4C_29680 [Larkinella insperata]|uniref:O-antigen polysaccharide polymerase Wzy n=1 Tax=Larkinella insperata TaxID=332158 RepID=A0ABW3QMP8_9BACT|nr:hypothetical protein [Larkinella insperata]